MLKYVENMLKNVKMFNFEKNLNIYINVKIMQNPVSKIAGKSKYSWGEFRKIFIFKYKPF